MKQNFSELITNLAYGANAPLDAALAPVEKFEDIKEIPSRFRYQGMEVSSLKLSNGTLCRIDYSLNGGTSDYFWRIKSISPLPKFSDISQLPSEYQLYTKGLEITVIDDETNSHKITKYWVTSATSNGVSWGRIENHNSDGGAKIEISGNDLI